jgi:hypothetical protein
MFSGNLQRCPDLGFPCVGMQLVWRDPYQQQDISGIYKGVSCRVQVRSVVT